MKKQRILKTFLNITFSAFIINNLSFDCSADFSNVDNYVVTVYNEEDGLPTGEANAVLQTRDGYIWIGSYGGLIRYDGSTFRNYSLEGGIISSSIRSLYEDSNGRLWIGTNDSGVYYFENDTFGQIKAENENSFLCIRDFEEGSDGTIYVASNSGMGEINGDTLISYNSEEFSETVYSVAVDKYDRVWGSVNSGRCVIAKDGILDGIITSDMLFDDTEIYCVASYSDGSIYIGTSGSSIANISFKSEELKRESFDIEYYYFDEVLTHNAIDVTDDKTVLVSGLRGFGIIESNGNISEFGSDKNALSVNYSIVDYEGNYWLASSSLGMIKYSKGCFTTPNKTAGIENLSLNTVTKINNRYYIGYDTGIIISDENYNRIENSLTELLKDIRVRCLISDRNGMLWIANYSENAILRYNPIDETITEFNSDKGLNSTRARCLLELSDGSIAVGTQEGLFIIDDDKVIRSYTADNGLSNTSVLCMLETESGSILAGSDGDGIYEIKDDNVINHGFNENLGEGVILRMLKDEDSDGYFISAGSSLYYWNNSNFKRLDNFEKGAGSIFDFYDYRGKLWLMQNNGVLSVEKAALLAGENAETSIYSFQHGLSGSLNANTWNYTDEKGNVYITTRNGISIFGFNGVENASPKCVVNKITVDGVDYEHPKNLQVDSNINRLTIDFAALSYTDTTNLRIGYYLDGFDEYETILSDSKNGLVSYTNLPGGEYIFNLKVYDYDNPGNVDLYSVNISKEKRVTEQAWFWFLITSGIVIGVAFIVWIIFRLKMRNVHLREQEYQQIIEQSLKTFAKAIDAKDKYTNGHSIRVALYSREIARRMDFSEKEQERIYYVALLHDIGKIGIPDGILNKPGKLTEEERLIIQTHPSIGGEILKDFTALDGIAEGAKYHHERYDGKGYCEGKMGLDIPLVARIIGVADTYDAMSSDRCYRKALSTEVIVEELNNAVGTQLDPEIIPIMLKMIEEGYAPIDMN